MSDNYIFNSPSIKTEETNTKVLNIWPGKGDEYSRVNILDLLYSIDKNLQYPFKLSDDNELVNATPAVGWFNASSLKDGVIKINGISFNANDEEGNNIGEKFVNLLNNSDGSPVDAELEIKGDKASGWFAPKFLTDKTIIINNVEYVIEEEIELEAHAIKFNELINTDENCPVLSEVIGDRVYLTAKEIGSAGNDITIARKSATSIENAQWANDVIEEETTTLKNGNGPIYIVHLTAWRAGEEGNSITLGYETEPVVENGETWASGDKLTGGADEYYQISISEGNIYLPAKTICPISKKENLAVPAENYSGYVILELLRDAEGNISYHYNVTRDLEENGFTTIYPTEI